MKWQPIETAPMMITHGDKDLLLYCVWEQPGANPSYSILIGNCNNFGSLDDNYSWYSRDGHLLSDKWSYPLYWMPLPEPPKTDA